MSFLGLSVLKCAAFKLLKADISSLLVSGNYDDVLYLIDQLLNKSSLVAALAVIPVYDISLHYIN